VKGIRERKVPSGGSVVDLSRKSKGKQEKKDFKKEIIEKKRKNK
jgi:hypothetical protein